MIFKKCGNAYAVRLEKGEEIVDSLKRFCGKQKINCALIQGIGAVREAQIGFFDTKQKKFKARAFKGDLEVCSLSGNATVMNKDCYLHLHAVIADEKQRAFGGHLKKAVISGTAEIIVLKIRGKIGRRFDEKIGLNLFKF